MTKKLIALLLTMLMLMISLGCSAQNNDAWKENEGTIDLNAMAVTGEGISVDGTTIKIVSGGDFEVKGTLPDGMIYVETDERVNLQLSGATIINSAGPAIYFANVDKGFVTLTAETDNHLEDGNEYSVEDANAALFSNDDLEIKGNGNLTVYGKYKHGIASDDDMNIESGNIRIESNEHGIKVNNTLHVTGGDITVYAATGKGMKAEQELIIDNGTITINSADEGFESKGTLVINGGIIDITSGEDGINTGNADTTTSEATQTNTGARAVQKENTQGTKNSEQQNGEQPKGMPGGRGGRGPDGMGGMPPAGENGQMSADVKRAQVPPQGEMGQKPQRHEGQQNGEPGEKAQRPAGDMPQNMQPPAGGGGFGRVDEETAQAHSITINGGSIYITAEGDGIDSNGNLTINGGTVVINGPTNSGNGSLDSEGTMTIAGGTVLTISNGGMMQLPRGEGNQNIISINLDGQQASNSVVTIKGADGNEIISYTATKEFRNVVLSDSKLETGSEYTLYINGEKAKSVTASDSVTYSGGKGGMGGMRGRNNGMGQSQSADKMTSSMSQSNVIGRLLGASGNKLLQMLNKEI